MLSRTPPMGFNTWNTFGENINDEMIRQTADKMVELGLKDAGYEYLVIDDCWSKRERDPETDRIVPDPVKFGIRSDSILESAYLMNDRYGTVAHSHHLGKPARFK